jgi:hypothetical protein
MLLLYFLMTHQRSVNFIRVAHDWEIDLFTLFFNMLYSLRLRPVERGGGGGGVVKTCYVGSLSRGSFTVRSFYNVLIPHDSTPFLGSI